MVSNKRLLSLLSLIGIFSVSMSVMGCLLQTEGSGQSETSPAPDSSEITDISGPDTSEDTDPSESTEDSSSAPTTTAKMQDIITVSFVGDITLCSEAKSTGGEKSFEYVVDNDMNYCFKNCSDIFKDDDLTIANLEGAVTAATEHKDKEFVFAMPPENLKMLTTAGIDAVNLANNHTMDFYDKGYSDTTFNLYCAGITWSDQNTAATYQVGDYTIGMFGICDWDNINLAYARISELKEKGCDIIIATAHWGDEAKYLPNDKQIYLGHNLIDHGVDIVVGGHPHRLQPIEKYNGKWIAYSISNFCFGGNLWLSDPDSVILQCKFVMDSESGNCVDYRLTCIPFCQTSSVGNDFCPVPYEWGSEKYYRVLSRLGWSQEDE